MTDRLHRTESVLAASGAVRLGLADWLGGILRRPPLARPDAGWEAVRAFVEALWWDIADMTPDPLSPHVEGEVADEHVAGIVPQLHPRLVESHPWSSGEEAHG
jgi:hypothetical protein